jgi:hypothetical protein
MPKYKKTRSREVEEENRRKKSLRQEEGKVMEAPGGEMAPLSSMAGDPVALLTSPQMAHPANAPLRAQATKELQRQRGNVYVQQLMKRIQAEKGSGRPLEPEVRAEMESAFGRDFSEVRVHTGASADSLAEEIGAAAFITGTHIFFRQGRYAPRKSRGRRLLAHELAHVAQQESAEAIAADPHENSSRAPQVRRAQEEVMLEQEVKLRSFSDTMRLQLYPNAREWQQVLKGTIAVPCENRVFYWDDVWHVAKKWLMGRQRVFSNRVTHDTVATAIRSRIQSIHSQIAPQPGTTYKYSIEAYLSFEAMGLDVTLISPAAAAPAAEEAEARGEEGETTVGEEWQALTPEEQEAAMDRFAQEHHVDRSRVIWTPFGPAIHLGIVVQEGIHWSEIPPQFSNEQIWELVREGAIRGVPITDEIRCSDWYRSLWDQEFQLLALREILGVIPQSVPVHGPVGQIIDNVISLGGNITTDRSTAERYLRECRRRTDLVARYYIILQRLGRTPMGGWAD